MCRSFGIWVWPLRCAQATGFKSLGFEICAGPLRFGLYASRCVQAIGSRSLGFKMCAEACIILVFNFDITLNFNSEMNISPNDTNLVSILTGLKSSFWICDFFNISSLLGVSNWQFNCQGSNVHFSDSSIFLSSWTWKINSR